MTLATYLAYESPTHYRQTPPSTAILYCSDGRLGGHIDDFARRCLGSDHFDRLAVPGGAACMGAHATSGHEREVVEEQLRFLVEAHDIHRIALIAHQDCGHYTQRLRIRGPELARQQCYDLLRAVKHLRQLPARPEVEAYYADSLNGRLAFHRLPL